MNDHFFSTTYQPKPLKLKLFTEAGRLFKMISAYLWLSKHILDYTTVKILSIIPLSRWFTCPLTYDITFATPISLTVIDTLDVPLYRSSYRLITQQACVSLTYTSFHYTAHPIDWFQAKGKTKTSSKLITYLPLYRSFYRLIAGNSTSRSKCHPFPLYRSFYRLIPMVC